MSRFGLSQIVNLLSQTIFYTIVSLMLALYLIEAIKTSSQSRTKVCCPCYDIRMEIFICRAKYRAIEYTASYYYFRAVVPYPVTLCLERHSKEEIGVEKASGYMQKSGFWITVLKWSSKYVLSDQTAAS